MTGLEVCDWFTFNHVFFSVVQELAIKIRNLHLNYVDYTMIFYKNVKNLTRKRIEYQFQNVPLSLIVS